MTPLRHHLHTLLLVVAGGTIVGAGLAALDRSGAGLSGRLAHRGATNQQGSTDRDVRHDANGACSPEAHGGKTRIDPALQMASLERDLPQGAPQRPVVKMARVPQRTTASEPPQTAPPVVGAPTVRAAARPVVEAPVFEEPAVPPPEPQPTPRGPRAPAVRMAEEPAAAEPWDAAAETPGELTEPMASEPPASERIANEPPLDVREMPATAKPGLRLVPRQPQPVFAPPPVMDAEDLTKDMPQARRAGEGGAESGNVPYPGEAPAAAPYAPRGPVVSRAPQLGPAASSITPRGVPLPSDPAATAPGYASAPVAMPAAPVGPAAPAVPATAPYMMVVARRAQEHINYGTDLAERGAFFSAESEFTQALLLIAQALDAAENTQAHSEAMASGLRALKEADEFVPRDTNIRPDIARIVATHKTPVLKQAGSQGVPPLVAMQHYYSYAQAQLALAGGHEPTAATALYGLARLQSVTANQNDTQRMMCGPKTIALHQAALAVDPSHYKAANELGVLLVRYGQLQDAQAAFLHSARLAPTPEAWQNLAHVYRHLGDERGARAASEQAQATLAQRRGAGAPGAPGDRPVVRYVDPDTFVRESGGPEAGDVARNESAPQPGTVAANTTTNATPAPQPAPTKTQSGPIGWIKSKAAGLTRTARADSSLQAQK